MGENNVILHNFITIRIRKLKNYHQYILILFCFNKIQFLACELYNSMHSVKY